MVQIDFNRLRLLVIDDTTPMRRALKLVLAQIAGPSITQE